MADIVQERRSAELVRAEIEQQLRELLDVARASAVPFGTHFGKLWDLGAECLLGGKMLRPRLLMGAYDAIADPPAARTAHRAAALRIAAATELLHFSFLLHDDVIDEDLTRRGAPNLIGRLLHEAILASGEEAGTANERALHWARSSGILLGDLMLSEVHQAFAREPLADDTRRRLLDLLRRTTTESVVGEHADVGLGDRIIPSDLNTVLEMSRLKTATYTFELPLRPRRCSPVPPAGSRKRWARSPATSAWRSSCRTICSARSATAASTARTSSPTSARARRRLSSPTLG